MSDPKKKLAEIRQHFGLELTSAHEAYPGHHLQFAIQNRHPSKLRRLAGHSIYYEGWTMWCEQLAVERGLVEGPYARLQQIHDALWRAHRIVIDCGLHSGALSYEGACKVLVNGVDFTKARAMGDVNWYTSSPTVPMSYLLGRIEVEKLHRRFVDREGWTLKQFNDWMLSYGRNPVELDRPRARSRCSSRPAAFSNEILSSLAEENPPRRSLAGRLSLPRLMP